MENKTQTAVEWLQDEYKTSGLLIDTDFAKAKEMEEQHLDEHYHAGYADARKDILQS